MTTNGVPSITDDDYDLLYFAIVDGGIKAANYQYRQLRELEKRELFIYDQTSRLWLATETGRRTFDMKHASYSEVRS